MAPLRLNSRERLDVYTGLFLLNNSFSFIVQVLDELAQTPIFSAHDLREMCGLIQEVQLEINTSLLNPLESAEQTDWARFGNLRKAMEKRLRGPESKRRKR
ncbi:MAG TPA: hypothetical protein VGK24_01900 [Candidatus Angelobacter sp.]